ncbi:MAG: beta-propeller domain-containing protein [Patescibacteria group bacterium]
MKKTLITILVFVLLFILIAGSLGAFFLVRYYQNMSGKTGGESTYQTQTGPATFAKFKSDTEFKNYFSQSQELNSSSYYSFGSSRNMLSAEMMPTSSKMMEGDALPSPIRASSDSVAPDRYSSTNVQVANIDEPDIVKTNGQEIFFSPSSYYYDVPIFREEAISSDMAYPGYQAPSTRVINALPADKISELSKIDTNGDLLLIGDTLIIFNYNTKIIAYDIKDPVNPTKSWEYELQDNSTIYQSRSYNDELYIIASTNIYSTPVCPMPLLSGSDLDFKISCEEIYHPGEIVSSDAVYTIMKFAPKDGKLMNNTSFVGSSGQSIVYMSPDNLYITYQKSPDPTNLFFDFLSQDESLFSQDVYSKVKKIKDYELSNNAKLVELNSIVSNYILTLTEDEKTKLENDLENQVKQYLEANKRSLTTTQINKINLADFKVDSIGEVPGVLLNQFSLDEYQDHLRVATTIGRNFWSFPFSSSNLESVNDVYVLDNNLKTTGSIKDLGVGERIYSVRFLSNQGYVVTFKETDPFYVLDLSNPSNPQKTGELKIPGYSSYLHPISDKLILGIGKEDSNVKVSLFDISDPRNPTEIDKYNLKEYWSDILNNYHAFMLDDKHQLFFLPGSNSGYIFSYKNNKLVLSKAISDISARRAIYINDNLYIIGDDKIKVYDENSWEELGKLDIK